MKKIRLIGLLVGILLLTSGCGNSNYIVDKDNNIVKYAATGQMLQKDILCLPKKPDTVNTNTEEVEKTEETEEKELTEVTEEPVEATAEVVEEKKEEDMSLYELYEKYKDQLKVPFEELPSCEEFRINSNKSTGLWEHLFVKPLAWLILKLGKVVGNVGISLILIGLAIRIILLPFTIKTTKQSVNMKKAQPEIANLEKKYANRTDRESLMMKSQETMLIYKKYRVNPAMGCLMAFIQLPLFFAFLRAIYRTPAIYEGTLWKFNLGMTPNVGFTTPNAYLYIILVILIAVSTYFSFKQSMSQAPGGSPDQQKQTKIMLYVMLVLITYASLTLPTAIAFYWIVTYAFIAIQNIIITMISNKSLTNKPKKSKTTKIKDKLVKKEGMKYGKIN